MINITNRKKCSGCTACASICPAHCITMHNDPDGFQYPLADASRCIKCGLCDKICPFLNPWPSLETKGVAAMASDNTEDLRTSSSGAVFLGLAKYIIGIGGVVVGASYNASWTNVEHKIINTLDELNQLQGSKYVQSNLGTILPDIKKLLNNGIKILFSGTPCQVAGLKHFLRKDYDNLLCVEVVCHGVPSPKAWQKYLSSLDIKPAYVNMRKRTERAGYSMFIQGASSKGKQITICEHHSENLYLRGFLNNLYIRPSCFACEAKNIRSHADITLGDFWTISKFSNKWPHTPELVLVNTKIGETAIKELGNYSKETIIVKSISALGNYLQINAAYTNKNHLFFSEIDTNDFQTLVTQLLRKSWIERLFQSSFKLFCKIKSYI